VDEEFEKAQCLLEVVPSLTGDGRIQLRFTPHITHGERKTAFISQCEAGVLHWGRQEQQPEEVYNWLSWSVAVTPNEYVVVGTKQEQGETLGERFFMSDEEESAVQRLLVVRTAHVPTPSGPADVKLLRSPPLALRASMTAVRGRGE
jgi:hypothetical protein